MKIPLTVAVLTYNRAHYLKEALSAILAQTFRDFELLILDNHSTDDTPNIVLRIKDDRVRYVRNTPGYMAAFNHASAIKLARGERVIVTHDDDIMKPTMLEKQMTIMDQHPDMVAVWTNVSIIDKTGKLLREYYTPHGPDRFYQPGEYIARYPLELLWPHPGTLMFYRKKSSHLRLVNSIYYSKTLGKGTFKENGGYDILSPAEMNTSDAIAFLNEPLLKYRQHDQQTSTQVDITESILHTYKALHKLSKKTPQAKVSAPFLNNFVLRSQAYTFLATTQRPKLSTKKLERLHKEFTLATRNTKLPGEIYQPLLPVSILLSQTGRESSELFDFYSPPDKEQTRAVRSLYQWAVLRKQKHNLFDKSSTSFEKIAIHGSVMIAALLIMEARERGVHVTCCLDSNSSRQNNRLLGVPIYPPSRLALQDESIDCVILSSEREVDQYLVESLSEINPRIKVISWKNLANN